MTVQTVLDYVFGRLDIDALDSTTNDHRIWMDDDIGLSLARNAYSELSVKCPYSIKRPEGTFSESL